MQNHYDVFNDTYIDKNKEFHVYDREDQKFTVTAASSGWDTIYTFTTDAVDIDGDNVAYTKEDMTDKHAFYIDPYYMSEAKKDALRITFIKEFAQGETAFKEYVKYYNTTELKLVLYVLKSIDTRQAGMGSILLTTVDRDSHFKAVDDIFKPHKLKGITFNCSDISSIQSVTAEAWRYRKMPWAEVSEYFPDFVKEAFEGNQP